MGGRIHVTPVKKILIKKKLIGGRSHGRKAAENSPISTKKITKFINFYETLQGDNSSKAKTTVELQDGQRTSELDRKRFLGLGGKERTTIVRLT